MADKSIIGLKLRRDWQARDSQARLALNTKFALGLSAIIAPGFAAQILGSVEIGLALLIGSVLGFLGASVVGVHASKRKRAIEDSYRTSVGENIRFAITEEQLERYFGDELAIDTRSERM